MGKIKAAIETMMDKNDPTHKLISLVAQQTDEQFKEVIEKIDENNESVLKAIEQLHKTIQQHNTKCPQNLETSFEHQHYYIKSIEKKITETEININKRIDEVENTFETKLDSVDEVFFFSRHKNLLGYTIIGIVVIFIIGISSTYFSYQSFVQSKSNGVEVKINGNKLDRNNKDINTIK